MGDQRHQSEGFGGAASFTAEGGFTHSCVGVFIFKTGHKENPVQPGPALGPWVAPLGSPAFWPCRFCSLLTAQCPKCPSKSASGLATSLLKTAPIPSEGNPQGPARPPWLLPPGPLCWSCPSHAGCLLLQHSDLQGHLRAVAQASCSAWKTHPRGSLPPLLQVSAQTLPSQLPPRSLLLFQPQPPSRTPGLLVLPPLFLPHSLCRNLAGRVFAALPNLSVSPREGSFKLVSFSAVASVLGMVLGIQ